MSSQQPEEGKKPEKKPAMPKAKNAVAPSGPPGDGAHLTRSALTSMEPRIVTVSLQRRGFTMNLRRALESDRT